MQTTPEHHWIAQLARRFPQTDFRQDTFVDLDSRQVLTTDMLVEGTHFQLEWMTPQDLGWKAIAASLSDIAATGAKPVYALIALGVPDHLNEVTLNALYDGIAEACATYRIQVAGGDTVKSSQLTISVTLTGFLPHGHPPGRRHTAQPGDMIAISGPHGLSVAGLYALQEKISGFEDAKQAHCRPIPQIKLGAQISQMLTQFAMMDSSDGLADAATQLARHSNLDVVLDPKRFPMPPDLLELATLAKVDPLDWILYGGEDYQLVVCLQPETLGIFPALIPIGRVLRKQNTVGMAYRMHHQEQVPLKLEKTFQHRPEPASLRP